MALRVNSPAGRELWTWVWPLANADRFLYVVNKRGNQSTVLTQETADVIEARIGELTVRINKKTGLLAGVQRGGKSFSLTNGPRPAVGSATLANVEQRMEGEDAIVTAKYDGDVQSITWRVRANGWVQCVCDYAATGPRDFFGVTFDYPEALVKKKKWLGDGPYRAWKNRRRGETLNVWENDYNNTITGWRGWVYPEFKGCFASVRWLQLETAEGLITAIPSAGQERFVQVLTPEFPPADIQAKSAVSLPKAGLAFLAAIPPLGSKFHPASDTGPQGQQTQAMGHYTSSVDFYFGPLP
jgi:hypothetical protein